MTLHVPEPEPTGEPWIVGKRDLARLLGWGRPRLDAYIERNATFPIHRRGDRSGGWEFSVTAVFAWMGLEPPSKDGEGALFDVADLAEALAPLAPLGLPIDASVAVRRAGLTDDDVAALSSLVGKRMPLQLPADRNRGLKAIEKLLSGTLDGVVDHVAAKLPPSQNGMWPVETIRASALLRFRMMGALFDTMECVALEYAGSDPANRDYVRKRFDGIREAVTEDCRTTVTAVRIV